jgi:Mrp family chromosome partitioning ATPase
MTPAQTLQLLREQENKLIDYTFLASGTAPKSITFTSPERHSGCSWLLSRIAERLAERVDASVCAVDANLHWPALHTAFGIENEHGLLEAMMRLNDPIRDFAKRPGSANLWVLPSGGTLSQCNAVWSTDNIKNRLAELSREFDYILIDTPAMKTSANCGVIGRLTGGVVLVLAANSSRRDTAINTKMMLEAANVPILGAVLNRRTFPIPDRIYRYL